jgi:hypothetical protein
VEGNAPIGLKNTEISFKHFVKMMGQPIFSAFKKCNKVWVAELLEKKHQLIICGQNWLQQLQNGPLHCETAVADILESLETWLPIVNFDKAKWIQGQ